MIVRFTLKPVTRSRCWFVAFRRRVQMSGQGPQKVNKAVVAVEERAINLLRWACQLKTEASPWEHESLLKQAREYAAAVKRLSQVRK